jgi:hypothetical protein
VQHIGYDYAKDHNCIGLVIYLWMKNTSDLNIHTRGNVIKDWRNKKCLLAIGATNPGFVNLETLNEWAKQQANPKFHREAYQSAYLKGYFKV